MTGVLSALRMLQMAPPTRIISRAARVMLPPGEYICHYTGDAYCCHFVAYFGVFLQILLQLRNK